MALWRFKKKLEEPADTGRVGKRRKSVKRSPPVAMEVKVLALEALEAGLSAQEAGELAGVGPATIQKWRKEYAEGGVEALARKASSIGVRHQCSVLEERIVAERKAHPEHGADRCRAESSSGTRRASDPGRSASRGRARGIGREGSKYGQRGGARQRSTASPSTTAQRAPVRAGLTECSLADRYLHVPAEADVPGVSGGDHRRSLALYHRLGIVPAAERGCGPGSNQGCYRPVGSASRDSFGQRAAICGLARPHALPEGAQAAGDRPCAKRASSSHDAGQDRAVLEDNVAGVFERGGVCLLRRCLSEARSLDPLLQSSASAPRDRRGLPGGPVLWHE